MARPQEEGDGLDPSWDAACPYCGEPVTLLLDPGGGMRQDYVEDCPVCCRPWSVRVELEGGRPVSVDLSASD